ncbi:hypothetical protein L1987_38464 [Smallanthus sonchifolius]|uniref:Uncharacterized protein n=1 Tax=Smallanthus sonchifolius TaxID=185202 RepID=A0ACB9HIQ6_9ASTR|nr:hypothetical protein L1987_38464 [Smallanthus sonchifolius]
MYNHLLNTAHVVRARQLQVVNLICLLVVLITRHRLSTKKDANLPTRDEILQRRYVREEMLHDLSNSGKCRDLIRMSEKAFMTLCNILKRDGGLRPTQRMSVEEHVARFLHIVGAIDGIHVHVRVPNKDAPRYNGRKGYPIINVLVACTFDLKFTYVLTGWEGTASDSRIIKNALTRDDKLVIPPGRYCLVDAGLPHTSTLMAPYRGVRYHLKEYSTRAPKNSKELFNLRHASLRNAIERAFGVLKKRFPIIRSTTKPFYSCKTQSDIFLACCILHNFLLEEDRDKVIEDEVIHEVLNGTQEEDLHNTSDIRESSTRVDQLRNSIANEMWTNYLMYPNNEIDMSKQFRILNYSIYFDIKVTMRKHEAIGNTGKKEQLKWTEKMDTAFIQAMVKQQDKGNRINGTFTSQAYNTILEELNTNLQMDFTKNHLKNLLKTLKDHFSQWASGAHAETAKERNSRLNKNDDTKIETITEVDDLLAANEVTLENQYNNDDDIEVLHSPPSLREQSSNAKKYKSKQIKVEQEDETFNSKLITCVDNVANAILKGNKIFDKVYHREYTGEEIYKELEPMGLEPHEIYREP